MKPKLDRNMRTAVRSCMGLESCAAMRETEMGASRRAFCWSRGERGVLTVGGEIWGDGCTGSAGMGA